MGRGLRTDLGDTAIFTSGKEEKSVKETGREGQVEVKKCMRM